MKIVFAGILFLICNLQLSAQTNTVKSYPVVISFGSMGTGVPSEAPLVKFITEFKKKSKIKTISAVSIGPFGREGEYKIAFPLTELSAAQSTRFIEKLTAVVAKMKDRGYASIERDFEVSESTMPSRAIITSKKF